MSSYQRCGFYPALAISLAIVSISASSALSVYWWNVKSRRMKSRIRELEAELNSSVEKCAAERQGRVRAQQALREAVARPSAEELLGSSYPMTPIGVVKSCFSMRNGTPRQPLLVPLARARLIFNASRVPPASLEGIEDYSHCWIIYVFHLNTDLEKLWKHPSRSKLKAKVRVPRLGGDRIGVFSTRSPHRPCPIGLTVAKVEEVRGHQLLLSGVDLVDGTPVLDIKPYLPYSDCVQGAMVPTWIMADNQLAVVCVNFAEDFYSTLASCWAVAGKNSMYTSPAEFQELIKEVLGWDIRSVSQRNRPHDSLSAATEGGKAHKTLEHEVNVVASAGGEPLDHHTGEVIYHLVLEGIDVSYMIDSERNVLVRSAELRSGYCGKETF
ncbi:hypothetical protein MLD38_014515 [Melastoma candidum]|uniref:Uncharacterized protein n=1 Tax=Melastoma candidum TaxID=119954 RepID=A0ACB9RCM7_9MYRT|nr:hypothetical protein MLD38_014515 [Melastoma candidum]